jgi:F-type H+-transporting ATPase subunit b
MAASERLIGQSVALDPNRSQQIVTDFFTKTSSDLHGLGNDVEVVTALPLSGDEQNALKGQIGASNVTFNVDPSILGGVIARSGERVIDGSVRAGLNEMAGRLR